jgi:Rrf2 family transcriptional regulator, iron-sulfur cluster assembly transcription factor
MLNGLLNLKNFIRNNRYLPMFSKATEYALRATIYIAQKSNEDKKPGIAEIAKAIDSPQPFTAKILQQLTKDNKVISSVRGPNGGFFITPKALQLPVLAILQALEEDEILHKCVLGLRKCSEVKPCPMHDDYKSIRTQLIQLFENTSIKNLAESYRTQNVFINNSKPAKLK